MAKILVFCESPRDFETIQGLVERVLREHGPEWVGDFFDSDPDAILGFPGWVPDGEGRDYFDVHQLSVYVSRHKHLRVPQGHFGGEPGQAGALMARTAFRVARELALSGTELDAVLLVWDMDDQGKERRAGLAQALDEARPLLSCALVLGCPDPMREAWVLAGFNPETNAEREHLDGLCKELGFNPCEEAHQLDAKNEHAKRSPKRVLKVLVDGVREREVRCWTLAPMGLLRARGVHSGLTAFLDDAAASLVPALCGAPPRPPPGQD